MKKKRNLNFIHFNSNIEFIIKINMLLAKKSQFIHVYDHHH